MRRCTLQRSFGRIKCGQSLIPVIGCRAVGIGSKTIEIKKSTCLLLVHRHNLRQKSWDRLDFFDTINSKNRSDSQIIHQHGVFSDLFKHILQGLSHCAKTAEQLQDLILWCDWLKYLLPFFNFRYILFVFISWVDSNSDKQLLFDILIPRHIERYSINKIL